jgi:hypothetical protein
MPEPVEKRKYFSSEMRWYKPGSWAQQSPEQVLGVG